MAGLCACFLGEAERQQLEHSRAIDRQLREDARRKQAEVKLLLLGMLMCS